MSTSSYFLPLLSRYNSRLIVHALSKMFRNGEIGRMERRRLLQLLLYLARFWVSSLYCEGVTATTRSSWTQIQVQDVTTLDFL